MAIVEDRSAPAPALPAEAPPPRAWRPAPLLTASAGLHAAVAAALAVAPHHWRLAVAALAGNHTLIAGVGMWPRSRLLGPNLCRFSGAAARRGEVALTFDDGPDPLVTPPVLDCLERYGVRATFFCIGRRAENHPELVAEMVRRGHRVENHSYSHPHAFACYPPAAMRREVISRQPLGRMGTPEDIANGVLFLASRDAAFISGTELTIDGALTATQID